VLVGGQRTIEESMYIDSANSIKICFKGFILYLHQYSNLVISLWRCQMKQIPTWTLQRMVEPSTDDVANMVPCGENRMHVTPYLWPISGEYDMSTYPSPAFHSHTRTVLSLQYIHVRSIGEVPLCLSAGAAWFNGQQPYHLKRLSQVECEQYQWSQTGAVMQMSP